MDGKDNADAEYFGLLRISNRSDMDDGIIRYYVTDRSNKVVLRTNSRETVKIWMTASGLRADYSRPIVSEIARGPSISAMKVYPLYG